MNTDRILCRDCRYNISERCYLNNPQGRTIVWTSFNELQPGCFSGSERRVDSRAGTAVTGRLSTAYSKTGGNCIATPCQMGGIAQNGRHRNER